MHCRICRHGWHGHVGLQKLFILYMVLCRKTVTAWLEGGCPSVVVLLLQCHNTNEACAHRRGQWPVYSMRLSGAFDGVR